MHLRARYVLSHSICRFRDKFYYVDLNSRGAFFIKHILYFFIYRKIRCGNNKQNSNKSFNAQLTPFTTRVTNEVSTGFIKKTAKLLSFRFSFDTYSARNIIYKFIYHIGKYQVAIFALLVNI